MFQILKENGIQGQELEPEHRDSMCQQILADNAVEHDYMPETKVV